MGIHKNIRDSNPLVLYTFDRTESYIEPDYNTGYTVNRTEFDFPPLMIDNAGLFYKASAEELKTIQPALSEIEQTTRYNSFSSGPPLYVQLGYDDPNSVPRAYTYRLNNSSTYAQADLTDQVSLITGSGPYTIFFQFAGNSHLGGSANAPVYRILDDIRSNAFFGVFSYASIVGVDCQIIPDDEAATAGFGFSSDSDNNNIIQPVAMKFGNTFTGDFLYSPSYLKSWSTIPYPYPMYYAYSYSTSRYFKVFEFGHVTIYAYRTNDNVVTLYLYASGSTGNPGYQRIGECRVDDILSVYVTVSTPNDPLGSPVIVYVQGQRLTFVNGLYVGRHESTQFKPILHVGIKSEWIKSTRVDLQYGYDLYESTSPNLTAKFDNIAIYNRAVTPDEVYKIFYTNYNYISIFKLFGYTQLYDFSDLYTRGPTRYIEHNTSVENIIGTTSYLSVYSHIDHLPYVERNNANNFEYVFKCTKYCMLASNRANNTNQPVSMIRANTGTLSFMFKTNDQDGIIFANSLYESGLANIVMLMSYGYLELWVNDSLMVRISGMANNEWHTVFISFGNSCSFYIDKVLYHTHPTALINVNSMTLFGNGMPGNNDLEVDFALIGVSTKILSPSDMDIFNDLARVAYSARGQITLNNIAVGTNIFIYNRHTGLLLEKLRSDDADGTFVYTNRYPYTITVIIADSTLISGKSYIVDPVEIE